METSFKVDGPVWHYPSIFIDIGLIAGASR